MSCKYQLYTIVHAKGLYMLKRGVALEAYIYTSIRTLLVGIAEAHQSFRKG